MGAKKDRVGDTEGASLGPMPKNRPGTHCLHMRVINDLNHMVFLCDVFVNVTYEL